MSYEDIRRHIKHKITTVNVNNPKANWGARVLKELDFDLDMLDDALYWAVNAMQSQFRTKNSVKQPGQAGLTMVSMSIGGYLLDDLNYQKVGKGRAIDQIRIGDLFLEAFVKYGYVSLVRPVSMDMMYMLEVTDLWATIGDEIKIQPSFLKYIKFEKITDGCLIKGEHIKRDQDTVWCRAAKKAMGIPWRINTPVYEALRASKHMFVSEERIDHGDDEFLKLKELQRISKLRDYHKIMEKGGAIGTRAFYQEAEVDYRGRLYYGEPIFNFQGSDWARGVLMFDEAKEVTADGEYWMAIHTANCYNQSYNLEDIPEWCDYPYAEYLQEQGLDSISVDKFTLDDRVRWLNENIDWITQAGRERTFKLEAEKPISFLACCIEWENLSESGDSPYYSRLPIAVDGTNNGWQHLGAISKDTRTGELVGLVATGVPRDFYVQTAKQLLEIDDPKLNAMPMKHVRKGISKRGSMTRAYSAGAAKIAENMWLDCRTEGFHDKYHVTEDDCKVWAKSLIKAINEVCPGPLDTMEYMQKLAAFNIGTYAKYRDGKPAEEEYKEIRSQLNELFEDDPDERDLAKVEELLVELKQFYSVLVEGNGNKTMRWSTPSEFRVKYECYQYEDLKCRGTLNGKQIKHNIRIKTERPDIRGYMCGISPNFVHSMDASHLALIVDSWDGSIGAVHDSFCTHASDVDNLVTTIKDTFVEMYDVDNFFDVIRNNLTGGADSIKQPELGSLEIHGVHNSDYFFA